MSNFTSSKNLIKGTSDLIIYSSMLDYYLKNFFLLQKEISLPEINFPRIISFHIFQEDLKLETKKRIEKIVSGLTKRNLDFFIYPLPLCLFNGVYPKIIQNHILDKKTILPPVFLLGDVIEYAASKEALQLIVSTQVVSFLKCDSCQWKFKKKCRGIYQVGGSYLCSERLQCWLSDKVSLLERGNLLDIGCGAKPPFLEFYKEISLKGIKIYLLDPSPNSLIGLKQMIPDSYTNITLLESTAEEIAFKDEMFDIVILTETYPHIRNLNKALVNIRRVLKNDGLLLTRDTTQSESNIDSTDTSFLFNDHFRNHNLNQAISELKKHRFEIIDAIEDKYGSWNIWAIKAKKIS